MQELAAQPAVRGVRHRQQVFPLGILLRPERANCQQCLRAMARWHVDAFVPWVKLWDRGLADKNR